MKKTIIALALIALVIASILAIVLTPTSSSTNEAEISTIRTAYGRYYPHGQVITDDYNEWNYHTDLVSDRTPTYAMPVCVWFDTNGTEEIFDDEIIDLTYNYDAEH